MANKLGLAVDRLLHPTDEIYGRHWQGKSFPLSVSSIRNASTQHGHVGALLREQRAVAKLLLGEPVSIAVMGGSMTVGYLSSTSWPKRLGELFPELGYSVDVHNLASRGSTAEYAVHHAHAMVERGLAEADIVIIDYSINDDMASSDGGGGIMNGPGAVRKAFKDLVAFLSALPSKPAVLAAESVHTGSYCSDHSGKCNSCETDVEEYFHWKAAKELQVPVVFYPGAVCASGSVQWLKDNGKAADVHPGAATHDLFARAVLGSLLLQAEGVCSEGFTGADFPPMRVQPETFCMTGKPVTYMSASSGEAGFKPLAHDSDWSFGGENEDGGAKVLRDKPGWKAAGDGRTGEIVFAIGTNVGWVHLEFLGSWEPSRKVLGAVDVYLDSDDGTLCRVDPVINVHSTQTMYEVIKVPIAGNHTLHIRNNGQGFHLMGIYAC